VPAKVKIATILATTGSIPGSIVPTNARIKPSFLVGARRGPERRRATRA
jgi:hypothetical protein